MKTHFDTLVDLVRCRAESHGPERALIFLRDGERQEDAATFAELDVRARAIAAELIARRLTGARALLLYPPGIEYICAFFGCLYAGVVAVPAYPPDPARLQRTLPRLEAIAHNADCRVVLSTEALVAMASTLSAMIPVAREWTWMATDRVSNGSASLWRPPVLAREDLAFLQYTSGSTRAARGAMLTHGNVLAQQEMIRTSFGHPIEVAVNWLPPYHDLGLIGAIIHPIYMAGLSVLMSPVHFMERPFRWLSAITRYRGIAAGGPNFSFDLCARKIGEEERAELDLSTWKIAYNCAEPIRIETIRRFADTFAPRGFVPGAFFNCWGLAEAALMVTAGTNPAGYVATWVDDEALGAGRIETRAEAAPGAKSLVGCGRVLAGQSVLIVDPDTGRPCAPDRVGEVWVQGPCVGIGYWRQDGDPTFGGRLEDGSGPYLRTGDLGFFDDRGELYIVGRMTDTIIINGRNFYPQDLEATVESCHDGLRPGATAAFAVEEAGERRLVVVQELRRGFEATPGFDALKIVAAARTALADENDASLSGFVLVGPGQVPKTSSGKLMRHACRRMYLDGSFNVIHHWRRPIESAAVSPAQASAAASGRPRVRRKDIERWLRGWFLECTGIPLQAEEPFGSQGVDSATGVKLCSDLAGWLGRPVPVTSLYDHPTLSQFVDYLVGLLAEPDLRPVGA